MIKIMFQSKYIFTFLFTCLIAGATVAQDLGLHFIPELWQANQTNPAFMTERKFNYAFPTVALNFNHSGFAYNDLIRTEADGTNVLDLDPVLSNLDDSNVMTMGLDVETVGFTFGGKIWRGSFSQTFKTRMLFSYPKDLVEFGWKGNGAFVGDVLDIGPQFQATSYSEIAMGLAVKLPKIQIGGRVKVLSGMMDISSEQSTATVFTSPEAYQTTLTSLYRINVSTLSPHGSITNFDPEIIVKVIGGNFGLGLDLGATMDVTEKLNVSASIVDLGAITWKSNATNYTSDGTYTYEGLDVSNILRDDEVDFEETLDTIEQIFDFQTTNESYSTALPTKFYISARYRVHDIFTAGGLIFMQRFKQKNLPGLALNGTFRLGSIASAGLTYSVYNKSYTNVGLSGAVRLGPVQLYAMADNMLAVFKPYDSQFVNARVGLNLSFK